MVLNKITLIEMGLAMGIAGFLFNVALPKFTTHYDEYESRLTMVGSHFASAIIQARTHWVSEGAKGAVDELNTIENHKIATTSFGWASDADQGKQAKHEAKIEGEAERCLRIWLALLEDAPPVSIKTEEGIEYLVEAPSESLCRYTYLKNDRNSRIEYDLATGSVITIL